MVLYKNVLILGDQSISVYYPQIDRDSSPHQPNRVLLGKAPDMRVVVAEEVVVQAGFLVEVLVLQAEWLVRGPLSVAVAVMNKLFPRVITPFPNEFALAVCHFSRHADLVTVEVVHGMLCVFTLFITLRQRLIAVGMGVNVGESAVGFLVVFAVLSDHTYIFIMKIIF